MEKESQIRKKEQNNLSEKRYSKKEWGRRGKVLRKVYRKGKDRNNLALFSAVYCPTH